MKAKFVLSAALAAFALTAASASAGDIVGGFNISGGAILSPVPATGYRLDFVPPVNPDPAGNGIWDSTFPASGYFTAIHSAPGNAFQTQVTLKDLTDTAPAGTFNLVGTGVAVNLPNFLSTFTAIPGLHFDLTKVLASSAAAICVGGEALDVSCRPSANSPFTLTQRQGRVDVSYGVEGFFRNGVDIGFGGGSFTSQFTLPGINTIAGILATLGAGTPIAASASGTFFSQAVPEPATVFTFGVGAGLLVLRLRRKTQRQSADI